MEFSQEAVTWDTQFFGEKNATLYIIANYQNTSDGGPIAFQSQVTDASQGFLAWTIDRTWLKGLSSNNVSLYLNPVNPIANEAESFTGKCLLLFVGIFYIQWFHCLSVQ